jgi:hypothetical protein
LCVGSAGVVEEGVIVVVVVVVGMGVVFAVDNVLANDGHVTEGAAAGAGVVLVNEKLPKGFVEGEGAVPPVVVAAVGAVVLAHVLSTSSNHDPRSCRNETWE